MKDYKFYVPSFFKFYGQFAYKKNVMSTHEGVAFSKNNYKYRKDLSEFKFSLTIFGPLNQEKNIAKDLVSNMDFEKFVAVCNRHSWRKMIKERRQTNKFLDNCQSTIDFMFNQGLNLKSQEKYDGIKANLQSLLKKPFGNPNVHFYGSRMIGVAENNSDLDIFIEIGNLLLIYSTFLP